MFIKTGVFSVFQLLYEFYSCKVKCGFYECNDKKYAKADKFRAGVAF